MYASARSRGLGGADRLGLQHGREPRPRRFFALVEAASTFACAAVASASAVSSSKLRADLRESACACALRASARARGRRGPSTFHGSSVHDSAEHEAGAVAVVRVVREHARRDRRRPAPRDRPRCRRARSRGSNSSPRMSASSSAATAPSFAASRLRATPIDGACAAGNVALDGLEHRASSTSASGSPVSARSPASASSFGLRGIRALRLGLGEQHRDALASGSRGPCLLVELLRPPRSI